ncbi:MAG TPA: NlpC/P60 family protein [Ignavibacteria bacterium]|nr:NlpC/P60 family protein [Ignavibacteria bacterium]
MRYIIFSFLFTFGFITGELKSQSEYQSPYTIKYTFSKDSLIYDILNTDRGDYKNSSTTEYSDWYSSATKKKYGGWGPATIQYSTPEIINGRSADWMRERLIAVATMFLGYGYQHHHIPDWDPPTGWPWKKTCMGSNGKGVDCSNFTAYIYNLGFGVKLNSNTLTQSNTQNLSDISNGLFETAELIQEPASYEDFVTTFKPGDLLFIKAANNKPVSHVIVWLGYMGVNADGSPSGTPLIMDSHGAEVKDSNGNEIPCGIHIRPFEKTSWYYNKFSHALRIIGSR